MNTKLENPVYLGNDGPEVGQILSRIAAFFLTAGISEPQLAREFQSALAKARRRKSKTKFVRMGESAQYDRVVDCWINDARYQNAAGRPRELPLSGNCSFTAIIKSLGLKATPKQLVETLVKVGAIKKTPKGHFSLIRRYSYYRRKGQVPYEPHAQFLLRAVTAGTMALNLKKTDKALFWLHSYSDRIPRRLLGSFMAFAKRRGELLLPEFDDWYGNYEQKPSPRGAVPQLPLVGLALFPFVDEPPEQTPSDRPQAAT